jgi:prepilin-type N-terminal cleavage/methylation domain-containing protein/prepilin-type processing-associated H-X9-DG protein
MTKQRRVTPCLGMTLIELMVVLAILSVLGSLLLTGVQSAREVSRRVACQNNLRQFGLALEIHHQTHRHYPTGGWGNMWVGDPDRGFGIEQPGGWAFNLLPYVEQQSVRDMSAGQSGSAKWEATGRMMQVPLPLFLCPSRRGGRLYPFSFPYAMRNAPSVPEAAKTDYAVNGGDRRVPGVGGPASLHPDDVASYRWPDLNQVSGIAFSRSRFRQIDVLAGLGNTIAVGEKFLSVEGLGFAMGDDQTLHVGDDADVRCFTHYPPLRDTAVGEIADQFGSRHPAGCHFLFCDGRVTTVHYDVEMEVFRALGNRNTLPP